MKVIQPNCRIQITGEDIAFIVSTLGARAGDPDCLVRLLTDVECRDQILDDEKLFHALLEHRGCVGVSSHLYFYVLVRQVLRRSGIDDRSVADYVAELLAEFAVEERTHCTVPGRTAPLDYLFEMVAALQTTDEHTGFFIRAHLGNQSLFLAGVFPERIRVRAERKGFPGLRYYEEVGRASFRAARDHRLARRYELCGIFDTLADRFQTTRRALNDLADRLCSLGEPDYALDTLLARAAHE